MELRPLKFDYEGIKAKFGKETADAAEELQSIFTSGLATWFGSLWDDRIGAFYYSRSARDNEGFLPDIESTSQAMGNLRGSGLYPSYEDFPFDMARKAALFAQGLQDEDDGFFYHPQWGKSITTSRRGRDNGNAHGLIRGGGLEPLYKDANSRIKEAAETPDADNSIIPEHLRSAEVFLAYLNDLNINGNSYSVGHRIGAQAAQIIAAGLTDVCIGYLNSHQYENGLWEKELTYRASNGLMKTSCAYRSFKVRMPRLMEAFDASLKIAMLDSTPGAITDVYNTFYTIENVFLALKETGDEQIVAEGRRRLVACAPELIRMTKKKLACFLRADGSFSYCRYLSAITSQGALASLGCCEGDVNATVIAIGTRRRLYELLELGDSRIYGDEDRKAFEAEIRKNIEKGYFPKKKPLKVARLEDIREERGDDIAAVVKSIHTVFTDGLYKWIAGLWDGERGGFYYSNSARDTEGFLPDIESTAQALSHFESLGLVKSLSELPEGMKKKLAKFVQSMQDEGDGYFYHPQWGKEINTSRRGRDLGNAKYILRSVGAKPLYPTADERFAAITDSGEGRDALPEHLRSEEAFRAYLAELDLPSDPYSKGHILGAQAAEIKAAGLGDICADYLDSTQLENGLWSKEEDYSAANALLKISGAYKTLGREFPRIKAALAAAIRIALSTKPATCLVEVYNPICTVKNLFDIALGSGKEELLSEAKALLAENTRIFIKTTKEKLAIFMKTDGSFSYLYKGSTPISQRVRVSLGLDEGDMNAMALADSSRARCLSLLGIETGDIHTEEMKKDFFRLLGEE